MYSIRKKLSILFVVCSLIATLSIALFVNITVNSKFNKYMIDIQNKKYERIVQYFEEIYKRDGKWTENSGSEMMHEAFMGNYCLTLLDNKKKVIWGMDPQDIREKIHLNTMMTKDKGVYNSKTFEIKSNGEVVGYVNIGQYSSVLLSEEDMNFKTSINKSLIAGSILTFIIIIFVSLHFSKQFSAPIKDIAKMSVNLSKGNFEARSSAKSKILELEDLRESVNTLAEKLKQQDSVRKKLVTDITHEIRTPLNVLQNNLEAMIDGVFSVNTERLISLNDEVIRFAKLLNNLNLLKQFEEESIDFNFIDLDIKELINTVCEDFYVAAKEKNIEILQNYDAEVKYIILGDKDKIKQVFINLISNAVKFTEEGGTVWINIFSEKKYMVVEIKDNGIGISKEDLPFIFERLYRADKSRQGVEGSGIGLTIAKKILQLHSAFIEVNSEILKGSSFKIFFSKIDLFS